MPEAEQSGTSVQTIDCPELQEDKHTDRHYSKANAGCILGVTQAITDPAERVF